jgi:hypothetical protein
MKIKKETTIRNSFSLWFIACSFLFGLLFLAPSPAHAVQTIPYTVNFQGRLTDQNGNALANGSYNVKFRLWTAASGGTNVWEEDHLAGSTDNRVTVTNGLFNVQLGSVVALSPSLFSSATYPLSLEVELPTPATASCATTGCASFTEGAMTPRQALAAVPYAFNAQTVDGIDGSSLAVLSPGSQQVGSLNVSGSITSGSALTATSANLTATNALTLGSTTSAGAALFQDGTVNNFKVTLTATALTASYALTLPSSAPATAQCLKSGTTTATLLEWGTCGAGGGGAYLSLQTTTPGTPDTGNFNISGSGIVAGTLLVGNATNGITFNPASGVTYAGTARNAKTVLLAPEYPGAVFTGSGTNNNGTLNSDFCEASGRLFVLNTAVCGTAGDEHTYYSWTTAQSTAQSYDIYIRYKIPSDFSAFTSDTILQMNGWRTGASDSVSLALEQANGAQCGTTTNVATGTGTWTLTSMAGTLTSCAIAAGDTVTFQVHLVAGAASDFARAGSISFNYYRKY